jgi:peptidoglycan/LPS O-acetylase OafA/YrhL
LDTKEITPPISDTNSGYMPQLDTLRTIAVALVLISHWLIENEFLHKMNLGIFGVTLFFVLSGFLISQILLKSRSIAEKKDQNMFHSVKQFYIRRFLRIFPIYYITLIILYRYNIESIRDIFIWYITYTQNIFIFLTNDWHGLLSHLWTLAVEEQFYLVWPFVILFIPKRFLFPSIIAIILIGPLSRTILYGLYGDMGESFLFYVLTPACMDAFGLGALMAYYRVNNKNAFDFKTLYSKLFIVFVFIFLIILHDDSGILNNSIGQLLNYKMFQHFFYKLSISVLCFYLVSKVSIGYTGILKRVFENKVLTYLGKISYGLYLFHPYVHLMYKKAGLPSLSGHIYIRFVVYSAILVLIASASWYILEKPINGLKRYFAYN